MGLESPTPPEGGLPTDAGEAGPVEARPTSSPPEPQPPAPATPAPELPKIAEKADDLEAIKKAVDDAAAVGRGLWLSYLFVLFYVAIAAGAVAPEDLFFERSLKLPFLNIELPLLAFCFLAPILFVIVHAYTLVHLVFLTDKAKRYHQALHEQMGDHGGLSKEQVEKRKAKRDALRRQLPSNIFIQFLAGPSDLRESYFGWLLQGIAWITLAVGPVLLLLLMQIRFLPFHRLLVTWVQRTALGVDLVLLWWLWRKVLPGRWADDRRSRGHWTWPILGGLVAGSAILFSVAIVTFPGEWQEELPPSWPVLPAMTEWENPATETDAKGEARRASIRDSVTNAKRVSLHDWLFNEAPDSVSRRRFPFSNTLVLTGLNIYEGLGIGDPDKAKWHDFVFRARGRDLKGAIFDLAILPKIDFEGADLEGASLKGAQLQGASLVDAQLQGALLDGVQLQGASLKGAQLQGASLKVAAVEATDLSGTHLWRTNGPTPPQTISAVRMSGSDKAWLPEWTARDGKRQPWDDKMYQTVRATIEALSPGDLRDEALKRIQSLDCSVLAFQTCDYQPPPVGAAWWQATQQTTQRDAVAWRTALKTAIVNDADYQVALAKTLKDLVCSGDDDAIYVVRGAAFRASLLAARPAAPDLIDDLTNKESKDCPVAALLTYANRANLLQIKQAIEAAKKPRG